MVDDSPDLLALLLARDSPGHANNVVLHQHALALHFHGEAARFDRNIIFNVPPDHLHDISHVHSFGEAGSMARILTSRLYTCPSRARKVGLATRRENSCILWLI